MPYVSPAQFFLPFFLIGGGFKKVLFAEEEEDEADTCTEYVLIRYW